MTDIEAVPLEDRVIVKLAPRQEKSKGGIHLPDSMKRDALESLKGEVLACGPGRLIENGARAPMQVKTGDTVLLGKYAGSDVVIEGEEFRIVNETEVLAVLRRRDA